MVIQTVMELGREIHKSPLIKLWWVQHLSFHGLCYHSSKQISSSCLLWRPTVEGQLTHYHGSCETQHHHLQEFQTCISLFPCKMHSTTLIVVHIFVESPLLLMVAGCVDLDLRSLLQVMLYLHTSTVSVPEFSGHSRLMAKWIAAWLTYAALCLTEHLTGKGKNKIISTGMMATSCWTTFLAYINGKRFVQGMRNHHAIFPQIISITRKGTEDAVCDWYSKMIAFSHKTKDTVWM